MKSFMKKAGSSIFILAAAFNLWAEKISVKVNPGFAFEKRAPQCALWLEDENGNFIDTIFVTKSAAGNSWKFSPENGRPESLPVWYHKAEISPSKKNVGNNNLDAVSAATPKKGIFAEKTVALNSSKNYVLKAEINQSFDYNDFWNKKNSGVNGQPSVIYGKEFSFAGENLEIVLDFLGTGSLIGDNGNIESGNSEKLTTALEIVSKIEATIEK